jgi:hypothetical protein
MVQDLAGVDAQRGKQLSNTHRAPVRQYDLDLGANLVAAFDVRDAATPGAGAEVPRRP